jgi:hypothetical protein
MYGESPSQLLERIAIPAINSTTSATPESKTDPCYTKEQNRARKNKKIPLFSSYPALTRSGQNKWIISNQLWETATHPQEVLMWQVLHQQHLSMEVM